MRVPLDALGSFRFITFPPFLVILDTTEEVIQRTPMRAEICMQGRYPQEIVHMGMYVLYLFFFVK